MEPLSQEHWKVAAYSEKKELDLDVKLLFKSILYIKNVLVNRGFTVTKVL